jgi:MFS family permease
MRFLQGLTTSATEPASFSILGDYFPKRLRATANSIHSTSHYIGAGLGSLLVLIVSTMGWRFTYKAVGLLGVIFGLGTLLFVREPERGF